MADSSPVWRLDQIVRDFVSGAMTQTSGHQQKAADLLGISVRTLSRKLKMYSAEQLAD
jgi:DNA-binding protein Fis